MKKIIASSLLITLLISCSDENSDSDNVSENAVNNELVGQWELSKRFVKNGSGEVVQETEVQGCNENTLIQFNEDNTYRQNDIYGDAEGVECFVNFDESGDYEILDDSEVRFTVDGEEFLAKVIVENGILEFTLLNSDPNDDYFEVDEFIKVDQVQEFFQP